MMVGKSCQLAAEIFVAMVQLMVSSRFSENLRMGLGLVNWGRACLVWPQLHSKRANLWSVGIPTLMREAWMGVMDGGIGLHRFLWLGRKERGFCARSIRQLRGGGGDRSL